MISNNLRHALGLLPFQSPLQARTTEFVDHVVQGQCYLSVMKMQSRHSAVSGALTNWKQWCQLCCPQASSCFVRLC